jgi:riboflavin biosynthesis pyrimidine reductase
MRDFQVLFDYGEPSELLVPAMALYGKLGFPAPAAGKPWIYANFVQTMDGIVSLLGNESGGADIGGLPEDRWLMDLLRAHADAVMLGMGTLREEQRMGRPGPRGPVFRIKDSEMQQLRTKLRRGRERNVLVTARANLQMSDYAVFDGDFVDVTIVTTRAGAERLEAQRNSPQISQSGNLQSGSHVWVDIIAVDSVNKGKGEEVDLQKAVNALTERYGIRYLLFEGGPSLYSGMLTAGMIDEKFVTVSPLEVGRWSASGPRPSVLPDVGFSKKDAARWHWLSCRKVDDYQFHRFRRK